jgi:hypothetical protein
MVASGLYIGCQNDAIIQALILRCYRARAREICGCLMIVLGVDFIGG